MELELIGDKKKVFPAVDNPQQYRTVRVWHCNYKTLAPLADFTKTEILEIATFPDESMEFLTKLTNLQKLKIIHLPKLKSIKPISKLHNLKELELSTLPSWDPSGQKTTVDSFQPIAELPQLERVYLFAVVPSDGDLTPLHRCPKLKNICTGNHFPIEQLAWLKGVIPDLEGTFFDPTIPVPHNFCKKCGTQKVMLSGVTKYNTKCPQCHSKRVQQHLADWHNYLNKAASQGTKSG
ncbi:MAG: hypothetical protein ACYTF1_09430 [Planctomycetota bacterium]